MIKPEFYMKFRSLGDLITYSPLDVLLRDVVYVGPDDTPVVVIFSIHFLPDGKFFLMYFEGSVYDRVYDIDMDSFSYIRHDMSNDSIDLRDKFEVEGGDIRYIPVVGVEIDGMELDFKVGGNDESD